MQDTAIKTLEDELERLVRNWQDFIRKTEDEDTGGLRTADATRTGGYLAGLRLCAQQLTETIRREREFRDA